MEHKWEYLVFGIETDGKTYCNRFKTEETILNNLGAQGYEIIQIMQDPSPSHSNWIKVYCKRKINE